MSSPKLVDDSNPAVQYRPGWEWETLVNEVDGTRHGAAKPGLSATLAFVGTGVQVIGTLQRSNGQPSAMFTIDGEENTMYNAPGYTSSADAVYNVTFYSRRDLENGNHEVQITNMDETGQNVLWLDYFLIDFSPPIAGTADPSPQTSTSTNPTSDSSGSSPPLSTSDPSSPRSSSPISMNTGHAPSATTYPSLFTSPTSYTIGATTSSSAVSVSPSYDPSFSPSSAVLGLSSTVTTSSTSSHPSAAPPPTSSSSKSMAQGHTGFIVGGVVGGLVLIITVGLYLFLLRRHRRKRVDQKGHVQPFTVKGYDNSARSSLELSSKTSHGTLAINMSLPSAWFETTILDIEPASALGTVGSGVPFMPPTSSAPVFDPGRSHKSGTASLLAALYPGGVLPIDTGSTLAQASPEFQLAAMTKIRSLLRRSRPPQVRPHRAEDSGFRMYYEEDGASTLPPVYSAE